MANHKSAIKRLKQSEVKRVRNKMYKSAFRTSAKKVVVALSEENAASLTKSSIVEVKDMFRKAESLLAKAASKGIIHKKTASRKISRLAKKLKVASQAVAVS